MNNTEIITKLKEIRDDLSKILDTSDEGRVPVWYDDNGNPTEWKDYIISENAQDDIYTIWREVRMIIFAMEGAN